MKRLLALLLLSLWAYAGPQLSPQGIIVNPEPGGLEVQTWINKDPAGSGSAIYQIGEKIVIYARVSQDAYVYLFNINADGRIDLILPNPYDPGNFMRAGEVQSFPPVGARYAYTISGPEGIDQVLAVASRYPLSLAQIADVETGQMRVQGSANLGQVLSIVVTPVPGRDWASDVVRYRVVAYGSGFRGPSEQPKNLSDEAFQKAMLEISPIPGARLYWVEHGDQKLVYGYRGVTGTFAYLYYHDKLRSRGWWQVSLKQKPDSIKAQYLVIYKNQRRMLNLEIKMERSDVVVKLEWDKEGG